MNLNYVPNPKERQHFYSNIYSKDASPEQPPEEQDVERKLTQVQLQQMLSRLLVDNKEYIVKQQIKKIQQRNQEWENAKNIQKRSKANHEVEERLLENGRKKEQKLESLRRAKELKQLQQLQPKPLITDRYLSNYRPLIERVPDIIQAQKNNLQTLSTSNNPKFVPTINRYSAFIAQIRNQNNSDFANRLHNNETQLLNKQILKKQLDEQMKKQYTFKPKINQKSISRISESHVVKIKQNVQQIKFQPKICKKSQEIVEKTKNGFKERLENDYNNRKLKEVELENRRKSQCSFKPKINTNSRRLASSRRVSNTELEVQESQSYIEPSSVKKCKSISSIIPKLSLTNSEISSKNKSKLQQLFGRKS